MSKHLLMVSLALISSIALSVSLVLGCDSWLVGHYRSLSVLQARKKLTTRDIKGAITTFDSAISQRSLLELINDPESEALPKSEDILRLVTPMQACNDERFGEVVRIYANSPDHLSHQYALELHKQVTKINQLRVSIEGSESKIRGYIALWHAPTEEMSALFGLRPFRGSNDLDIPHYAAGVLASLPKLDRLRDNIDTLVDLRDEIKKLGGTVAVSGSDAAQQFAERLRLLRVDCAAITEPFDQLVETLNQQKLELIAATTQADQWCKKGAQLAIDELSGRIV